MRLTGLACSLALLASALQVGAAQAATSRWIGSWGASPAMPMVAPANSPLPGTPSFNNQTIVQVVRLSAGGQRLRLRLTNEYGALPLEIGAARVALVGPDGLALPGTERAVSFAGAKGATVPANSPLVSDPVTLPTPALARLRISLYLPGDTHGCTCHAIGLQGVQVIAGDATAQSLPAAGPGDIKTQYRAFLSEVDVEATAPAPPVIVAFGDSITDGYQSSAGTNRRWPDRLAERLAAKAPGTPAAVVNAGIGGNRVLSDGAIAIFGQSALARFDRDVLSVPGATHLIVLEGVNDLGDVRAMPTADALIAGYRQLIERAHAHGIKVIGATVLPYGGAFYYRPEGDARRGKINAWIRTTKALDGVIDFDAAIRDPAKPERMRADLQSGDWLHPNDAGYRVMGDAVSLALFR